MYILIADLHIHFNAGWKREWFNYFLNLCLTIKSKHKLEGVVFLGDVFEVKNFNDCEELNYFMRFIKSLDVSVLWVTGQHDTYKPNSCTLEGLSDMKTPSGSSVTIIDKGLYNYEGVYMIPYNRDLQAYRTYLCKIPDNSIVFTHMPVIEALPIKGDGNTDYISYKEFDRFKVVFSGDIHGGGAYGRLKYIGAPYQSDFRYKTVRGAVGLFSLEEKKFRFIKTKHPFHIDAGEEQTEGNTYIVRVETGGRELDLGSNVIEVKEFKKKAKLDFKDLKQGEPVEDAVSNWVDRNPLHGVSDYELKVKGCKLIGGAGY